MRPHLFALAAALAAVALISPVSRADVAPALVAGETIEFIVADEEAWKPIFGGENQQFVFVGPDLGTMNSGGCAPVPGEYPVQRVVAGGDPNLVTANTFLAGERRFELTVISQQAPVQNGTRIADVAFRGNCSVEGRVFVKFRGIVQ